MQGLKDGKELIQMYEKIETWILSI